MVSKLFGWSFGRSVNWSVGQLVGRSVGHLVRWLVGQVATKIPFFFISNSDANGFYALRVADYENNIYFLKK